MKKNMALVACLLFSCPVVVTAQTNLVMRTWVSVNGNEVRAAFLREEDGRVFLQRPDGKVVATRRSRLSPDDLAWIDARSAKSAERFSFPRAKMVETNHMEQYRLIRRIIVETLTRLTNNARNDKRLAFVIRDAFTQYGWVSILADYYQDADGKAGKVKSLRFTPRAPVVLREAVAMVRDKFVLPFPETMDVRRVTIKGNAYWEVLSPPPYVSRILLAEEDHRGEVSTVNEFALFFPPPRE
ncbi:MAG: hypothetical protein J6Z49_11060 [Kiritimatiellae bacterium]|nr:hypothetical protein [Kiritimatiellia bacterium]